MQSKSIDHAGTTLAHPNTNLGLQQLCEAGSEAPCEAPAQRVRGGVRSEKGLGAPAVDAVVKLQLGELRG